MRDDPDADQEEMQSRADFEGMFESIIQELDQISEEEYEEHLAEMDEHPLEKHGLADDVGKAEIQEFFSGILGYMQRKRELQGEQKDVTAFADDEWEDGFEFLNEITGDDDVVPTCLECDANLDPDLDDARVAADGGIIYTHCSHCGEATLEDNRARNTIIRESLPDLPDADEIESVMPDDVREAIEEDD